MKLEHRPIRAGHFGTTYLTEKDASVHLKVSPRSLQRWRQEGSGPRYHRFGGLVRYTVEDIDAWAATRSRLSTSESDYDAA